MSTDPRSLPEDETNPPQLIFQRAHNGYAEDNPTAGAARDVLVEADKEVLKRITPLLDRLFASLEQEIAKQPPALKQGQGLVALALYYRELGRILSKVSSIRTDVKATIPVTERVKAIDPKVEELWADLTKMVTAVSGKGPKEIGKLVGTEQKTKIELIGGFLAQVQACRTALGHPAAEA